MDYRHAHAAHPPEQVVRLHDPASGLDGVIALHSTHLGPAAGGCRLWTYPDPAAAIGDALRLAEGMSYKNALAGLPLGGGKAVLRRPEGEFDRAALFRAFGEAVEELGGRYVTAEDVGTTVGDMAGVARQTRHVAGLPPRAGQPGRPGGDPSPWTASGVFRAMEAAAEHRLGRPIGDCTVAIQGLGSVGAALAGLLHQAGARLIVAEPRSAVAAEVATRTGAEIASLASVLEARCDIFAPCALGGVLTARTIPRLRAAIVCGAANNQLGCAEDGTLLADRGILYAPDYVANAGGIINVCAEYLGWSGAEVSARIAAIPDRLRQLWADADGAGIAVNLAADRLARATIAGGRIPAMAAP
jgi:leucine dehydrogenase